MDLTSTNQLQVMLEKQDWVLANSATDTNLSNMVLSSGNAPEFWNKTAPEKIKALYKGSVEVGSDLF